MKSLEAFSSRIRKDDSGCWIWAGAKTGDGYGYVHADGKRKIRAHRMSLILHGTEVPDDKVVMHKCDVPLCVNPEHLVVGTHAENIADKVRKGRAVGPKGMRWKLDPGSRSGERNSNWGKRRSHCKHGHEFTPENTVKTVRNTQRCKACDRIRNAKYKLQNV